MFLTFAFHHKFIKWIIPTTYLVMCVPGFLWVWSGIKVTNFLIPKRYKGKLETKWIELFQRQVLFFLFSISPAKVESILSCSKLFYCYENKNQNCLKQRHEFFVFADLIICYQSKPRDKFISYYLKLYIINI